MDIATAVHPAFDDLLIALEKYADRAAIIEKDGSKVSYAEFQAMISGAVIELKSRGVKKGTKVLVAVPMSADLYAILQALFSLGAPAIFLDPWMGGKKMGSVIHQVEPDLFITTPKIALFAKLLPATWRLKKWKVRSIVQSSEPYEIADVQDNDNALITFTSGTGGKPKGANRTFTFLDAQAKALKSHLSSANDEGSIDYTNFPIVGLAGFAVGNTVVIPRINLMKIHEADPEEIATHLIETRTNRIIVSPSLLSRILIGTKGKRSKHMIREVVTGGAPISKTLIQKAINQCTDVKLEAIYGSTEAEPICITEFRAINQNLKKPLKGIYVGAKVNEVEIKILEYKNRPITTDEFNGLQLEPGLIGEVVVTGDHVNKGYYKNPEAFDKVKIEDMAGRIWHRTGDMGYFDGDELFLVGRDHRIMERYGKKFYPYPLEQYVEAEFGLTDLGYVQLPNEKFVLFIGGNAEIDEKLMASKIEEAGYPLDRIEIVVKPLPRDARHKSKLQIENLLKY